MSRESASRTSQSRVKNSWSGDGFQSVTVLSLYFCSEKKERLAVVYSLSEILLYKFSLQACSNGGKFWQGQGIYCIGFILCMLGKMKIFPVFNFCSLYIECGLSIKKYLVVGFFLAFGENNSTAGSGATLPYSPTPCLKIRNMFDAEM